MPTTTLKIGGSAVNMAAANLWPAALALRLGGYSTLSLTRTGGPLPGLPDPFLGKTVELSIDGVVRFAGDVTDSAPQFSGLGWTVQYQCRDLRARGDRVPFTDSNTKTDAAEWNLHSDDPLWMPSRAGRTVGQILTDALTMVENAAALDARGIGGYLSLSPPTLPTATVNDLAALTLIPPAPVSIGGEKLLGSIESFLSAWAPNHALHVRPDGVIRFLDLRATSNRTLTLEVDPIHPSPLSRSVADCFGRVVVRGQSVAEPKLLSLLNGGLAEDFAWGIYDNATAKANWLPEDFERDQAARSVGTCSCTDTLTVVLTSDPAAQTWGANEWDQTHRRGNLFVWDNSLAGVNQFVARPIASNTAKAAGGTSTVTLDAALPATSYGHYVLYGVSSGASFVWRKYKIADPAIAAAVARQFTRPVPYVGANGDSAFMTSFPLGSVCWSANIGGGPPYGEVTAPFSVDPAAGTVLFSQPTYFLAGNQPPADVRVMLAVNTGNLTATKPASGHAGTAYTVDGLAETLTITVPAWRDPANQSRMDDYAQDLLDSVKDAVIEGEVLYNGLYVDALDFGIGLSITGGTYATGWEALNVPVTEVEVRWLSGSAFHYATSMRCSNRRSHYTTGAFLRPDQSFVPIGGEMPALFPTGPAAGPEPAAATDLADEADGFGGFASFGFDEPERRYGKRPTARKAAAELAGAETAGLAGPGVGGLAGALGSIAASAGATPPEAKPARRAAAGPAADPVEAWANQATPGVGARMAYAPKPAPAPARDDSGNGLDRWLSQADTTGRVMYGEADGGMEKANQRAAIETRNRQREQAREKERGEIEERNRIKRSVTPPWELEDGG